MGANKPTTRLPDPNRDAGTLPLTLGWRQRSEAQSRKISSFDPSLRRIECPEAPDHTGDFGVPLGGIGTGGITWSPRGNFTRWSLAPGAVQHFTEPGCGFALRARRSGERSGGRSGGQPWGLALQPPPGRQTQLRSFCFADDRVDGDYQALFPKAWRRFAFPQDGIELHCEAFSPVIAGDLASACLPVALFRWTIRNTANEPVEASLLAHWVNMSGWFHGLEDRRPRTVVAGTTHFAYDDDHCRGIVFDQADRIGPMQAGNGQFALLATAGEGINLSRVLMFNSLGDGQSVWQPFIATGSLQEDDRTWIGDGGFRTDETCLAAGALCAQAELLPGESKPIDFCLAWDLPLLQFGLGDRHWRAHTATWGRSGRRAADLANHALHQADEWSTAIDLWHQQTEREQGSLPHQAGFALNELYLLVDGGTILTASGEGESRPHFGLLECPDYPFYNTLDLYVYAAEAVARHFPELDRMVIEDYAASVDCEDLRNRKSMAGDQRFPFKRAGFLPHDLGTPEEAPFRVVNGYVLQDSTRWKDLNSQFVLSVWRLGRSAGPAWLKQHYAAVRSALEHLAVFDRDGDGLIENEGFPDQTFDNIPMLGPGSYCGGLWLAALAAGVRMAGIVKAEADQRRWSDLLARGRMAFEGALWTGEIYRLDRDGPYRDTLFLEQLFGPFLARRYGLGDIVPAENARRALATLWQRNFIEAGEGRGAVLLTNLPRDDDTERHGDPEVQRNEVITGIAMSFAAQCRSWGLTVQADQLRRVLHQELHLRRGLFFRTPAAYEPCHPVYRAPLNLRPLAIWLDTPDPIVDTLSPSLDEAMLSGRP